MCVCVCAPLGKSVPTGSCQEIVMLNKSDNMQHSCVQFSSRWCRHCAQESLHVLHPVSQKLPGVFLQVVVVHAGKYCDKCWSKKAAQFHAIYICVYDQFKSPATRKSQCSAGRMDPQCAQLELSP